MSDKDSTKDDTARSGPPGGSEQESLDAAALEKEFFEERSMQELREELESADAGADDGRVEGEDELERLMAPKKSTRHPVLAVLVIAASLFGMYWLWDDFRFFLRSGKPEELGQASVAVEKGKLRDNTYVTLRGRAITQTMANSKYRSMFGGAAARKVYWFILADTQNRVVVRAKKPLILDKHKPGPHVKVRPGVFTGRLRRLRNTSFDQHIRAFYLAKSRQSKALQRERVIPAAALLQHAGKAPATVKDVQGKPVALKQDSQLALFVNFPGDYELKIHTEITDPVRKVVLTAGKGARECGKADPKTGAQMSGRGGSIYFKHDPGVHGLDQVAAKMEFSAADGQPAAERGGAPIDGKDLVIPIPPGTVVFNAQKRDCAKVCQRAEKACLKSCSPSSGTEITKDEHGLILAAVGGRCGGYAGERHTVNLNGVPFKTAKRASAYVASLGHPWVMVEDASKTPRRAVNFVLRMDPKAAQGLMKRQNRNSPYNIAPRYDVYFVNWRHLRRRGSDLEITRTNRGYPRQYEVKKDKQGRAVLEPLGLGAALVIPGSQIEKAEHAELLELPAGAFVLEEGIEPSTMWEQPFLPGVPIFYGLLIGFVLFNLLAIRAHFRG